MNLSIFSEVYINIDILCLEFHNDYILAGIGNHLYIYEKHNVKCKVKIFDSERIHNINIFKNHILLRGCKQAAVGIFSTNSCNVDCTIFYKTVCADWIHDIIFDVDKKYLILATAHNSVEVWKIGSENCSETYTCEEKCLLYSCKFFGNEHEDFILLSGTVFSEVIIWAPFTYSAEDHAVLARLQGHKGVIFSITIDSVRKLISTTSDDRSLRIWAIETKGPLTKRKNWENAKISLIFTLYGHTARVWKSCILSDSIVSAGEDSKLCIWNRNGKMENYFLMHQESGIRGLSINSDSGAVITSGEDGGITLLTRDKLHRTLHSVKIVRLPNEIAGIPRRVAFSRESIFCITDRGCLLRFEGESLNKIILENRELSKCCVLELSMCKKYVLLGMVNGRVIVMEVENSALLFDEVLIAGKLLSLHWVKESVIACTSDGLVKVYEVDFYPSFRLFSRKSLSLPHSKERWTTCALMCNNLLLLGDRMGSIHVYCLHSSTENPKQSFFRLHNYLGVTHLFYDRGMIFSSGRDGTIKQFYVNEDSLTYSLSHKLPMVWAWKIIPYRCDYLVVGFASISFLVWSLKKRELLFRYDCGGGHRSCDLRVTDNQLSLIYVRDKRVYLSEFPLIENFHIRYGFHGREINCLRILQTNPVIAVSAGEDTTVRIFRITNNDMEQLFILENHISSVRDIAVHSISETERLIISVGGRAQFSVHKFDTKSLRYEEKEKLFLQQSHSSTTEPSSDGETRIMCIDVVATQDGILVCAGCSDFKIRLLHYDNTLQPLIALSYSHCILKIKFIRLNSLLLIVSAATDGYLVFWKVSDIKSKPFSLDRIDAIGIHQSGINSLHVEHLNNGKLLLVTGGDDNLLSAVLLHFHSNEKFSILHSWSTDATHSCQITGIKIVENVMLSASIDQRLTVWQWSIERDTISVGFISQYLTSVPDLQGLEASCDKKDALLIWLYGKGLEIIEVDLRKIMK